MNFHISALQKSNHLPKRFKTQFIIVISIVFCIAFVLTFLSFAQNNNVTDSTFNKKNLPIDSSNSKIRIMCVGDIMTHIPQVQAAKIKSSKKYDFSSSFEMVRPLLKQADIVIGNLETVLAGDKYGLTGYPSFNGPQVLAFNLKDAGFTVLTTANNHSFDKSYKGLKNTLHLLDSAGLMHTGTYSDTDTLEHCLIISLKSFKIGIFSYTYGINGKLSESNKKHINIIDTVSIEKDLEYMRSKGVSTIIASVHFGVEYTILPTESQKQLVTFLWKNGVSVVFGHHSHVLQPLAFDTVNNHFAVFSLGNFMSNQRGNNREFGGIADLTLEKNTNNQIRIVSAIVHPTCMYQWVDMKHPRYSILLLEDLLTKKLPLRCPEKVLKIADTIPFIERLFHALDGKFYHVESDTISTPDSSR